MKTPIMQFTNARVGPINPGEARQRQLNFMPNLTVGRGQLLGQVSAANANEVQTINFSASGNVPNGGTFPLLVAGIDGGTFSTGELAYNISNANLKIAIEALFVAAGYEGITVTLTNGPAPADVTVTFGGWGAYTDIPLMTTSAANLTSAGTPTVTVDATTAGVTNGLFGLYDGTKLADPTVAPTAASSATGSLPLLAQFIATYTFITAQGETLQSPGTAVALTTTDQSVTISAITLPTGATGVNYYLNGIYAGTSADGAEKVLGTIASTASKTAPDTNTAFTCTDGRHIARAISEYDFRTDQFGRVAFGVGVDPQHGDYELSAPAWFGGIFATSELVGLDANAVSNLGRLESGTIADGMLKVI